MELEIRKVRDELDQAFNSSQLALEGSERNLVDQRKAREEFLMSSVSKLLFGAEKNDRY